MNRSANCRRVQNARTPSTRRRLAGAPERVRASSRRTRGTGSYRNGQRKPIRSTRTAPAANRASPDRAATAAPTARVILSTGCCVEGQNCGHDVAPVRPRLAEDTCIDAPDDHTTHCQSATRVTRSAAPARRGSPIRLAKRERLGVWADRNDSDVLGGRTVEPPDAPR